MLQWCNKQKHSGKVLLKHVQNISKSEVYCKWKKKRKFDFPEITLDFLSILLLTYNINLELSNKFY